jgi:hypothetical protein
MSNPTTGNQSQFLKPFDLPDILPLTPIPLNPTVGIINLSNNIERIQWNQSSQQDNTPAGNGDYANWSPASAENTNITLTSLGSRILGIGAARLSGFTGVPQIAQGVQNLLSSGPPLSGLYATLPFDQLHPALDINTTVALGLGVNVAGIGTPESRRLQGSPVKYDDFRSRLSYIPIQDGQINLSSRINKLQVNGASAGALGSVTSIVYAGASASPVGPYSIFNLESWFGWGEHDNPSAIRTDFTAKSHVTTRWANNRWQKVGLGSTIGRTTALSELALPFRGDKINVIDFSKRTQQNAYRWIPSNNIFGDSIAQDAIDFLNNTRDFIKFYFTGPKIQPGGKQQDDVIVFRASITNLGDSFSADWSEVNMIGRADPNYYYGGYGRSLSLSFDVHATDRDELKPIWRKLNALAGYTAPIYDKSSIAMRGPWMRITIGDLFIQTPVVLTTLSYDYGFDAPWEINIEDDKEMMQVPLKISVQCGFNVIGNDIPQNNGRFFGLAKRFDDNGIGISNSNNWLSDFQPQAAETEQPFESKDNNKKVQRKKSKDKSKDTDVKI